MTTEFDPQGRVYWGPHALSFPSAIWFDTSQDPSVSLKLNIGGEGSTAQYLTIATFNKSDPKNSLSIAGNAAISLNAIDGISATENGNSVDIKFDTTTLTNTQVTSLETLLNLGEVNTVSNQGNGEALFKQKVGADFQFFSLNAVDGVSLNKTGDIINLTFDTATLTNTQLDELRQSLLPTNAQGMLTNDGFGMLSWVSSSSATNFASTQGTIANTGTGQNLDLDLVASAASNAIAQFMVTSPNDPAAQALAKAVSALGDGDSLHNVLLAHYSANTTDLAALQSLLGSGTADTRVVLSFADADNDGTDDSLRMSVYAVDAATNNITGTPLSFTDLPLSRFANGGGAVNGAWQVPTLLNGWEHFIAPHGPMRFMKDALGFVHLRGLVNKGVSNETTPIFQLPVGYRPGIRYHFPAWTNSFGTEKGLRISADPGGNVCAPSINISSQFYVSLNGISFLAEG